MTTERTWRDWGPRDWAVVVVLVVVGYVLDDILLPAWLTTAVGFLAYIGWFVLTGRRRRRQAQDQQPPGQSWTPPLRDPGSDS